MTNVHQLSTLEQVTCYAIIIAIVLAVIKQFQYPLMRLNPFRTRHIVDSLSNRLEDCELEKYNQNQINIELKQRITKVERIQRRYKHKIEKRKKKNERTD